jgi:hypothetical protein
LANKHEDRVSNRSNDRSVEKNPDKYHQLTFATSWHNTGCRELRAKIEIPKDKFHYPRIRGWKQNKKENAANEANCQPHQKRNQ